MPKDKVSYLPPVKFDPMIFKYNITEFDTYSGKSKDFYALLIINKAKYPKKVYYLISRFGAFKHVASVFDPL